MAFSARFSLDLHTASTRAFAQLLEDFEEWRKSEPLRTIDLANGWKEITPEIAEAMLLRNPIGANRRPTLPAVKYYARQMTAKDWKKTGQPIIFDSDGKMLDAGHRLWACYLSGASFPSYVVGDVPPDPVVFAYIDNSKARSAADALSTAGLNGLAKKLSMIVTMAMRYDQGCFTTSAKKPIPKVTPIEVVRYTQEHPNLRLGARLMAGEYKSAAAVSVHFDVAAFTAFKILDLYGEDTLEAFMLELGNMDADEHEEGSPIAAMQKVMKDDEVSKEPMEKHQVLGHLIKAFNAWITHKPVKRISLSVNEVYPHFTPPPPMAQAAE
jgi:hypothetical protein